MVARANMPGLIRFCALSSVTRTENCRLCGSAAGVDLGDPAPEDPARQGVNAAFAVCPRHDLRLISSGTGTRELGGRDVEGHARNLVGRIAGRTGHEMVGLATGRDHARVRDLEHRRRITRQRVGAGLRGGGRRWRAGRRPAAACRRRTARRRRSSLSSQLLLGVIAAGIAALPVGRGDVARAIDEGAQACSAPCVADRGSSASRWCWAGRPRS